jgi:hypothetical protein
VVTLRCESLEVLPTGAWRVMATLTAGATTGLVELRFEIDPGAGDGDWLVLGGRACWIDGPLARASGLGLRFQDPARPDPARQTSEHSHQP